ncbi:unnamed protein product, partial [Chrysoparadoxa australica]
VYKVSEARQSVAVYSDHFYVINNDNLIKYSKETGEQVKKWKDDSGTLEHLNSGVIYDGLLYSVNTNYPESPMASSLEIFDTETLEHVGNHSFGILKGSATWVYKYQGDWFVAFAHYSNRASSEGKDNRWTTLVRFDQEWREKEGWIFPKEVIEEFGEMSNSGGIIRENGHIFITGHDEPMIFVLSFPKMGYTLKLLDQFSFPGEGQGIALERISEEESRIYGIRRKESEIVVTRMKH